MHIFAKICNQFKKNDREAAKNPYFNAPHPTPRLSGSRNLFFVLKALTTYLSLQFLALKSHIFRQTFQETLMTVSLPTDNKIQRGLH